MWGRVCLESRKRQGGAGRTQVHRRWPEAEVLCERPPVLWMAPGTPVVEADGSVWSSPYPVVCWLWEDRWFHVMALCRQDGTGYYCDLATPPVWNPACRVLHFVDLELDVRIDPGGTARVVDQEEFDEAVRRGWITRRERVRVQDALAELLDWAARGEGPFDPSVVDRWRRVGECVSERRKRR